MTVLATAVFSWSFSIGCAPEDDERCGGPTEWIDNTCMLKDTDTTTDTDADAGYIPEGMGLLCSAMGYEAECAEHEASYCLLEPGKTEGYCTMGDCSATPNDCPGGYRCCNMPIEGVPNFCATEEDFLKMGSMCEETI